MNHFIYQKEVILKVLIACEYSGTIRNEFTKLGHNAWSCDLLDTEIPGNHYKGDIFDILYDTWDLIIAHPPCTDLAVSGARHFEQNKKTNCFILGLEIRRWQKEI
jgi:hypothetical protein